MYLKQKTKKIIVLAFLIVSMAFGLVNSASAQILKDPIDTTQPIGKELPQYNAGVDQSIKEYLCVPDESNIGVALYDCLGRVYRFGIAFGSIALVFFVVLAGYYYILGGESSKEKGKSIFLSALTGMIILLSSFVLLRFINPSLVQIRPIQPPIFTAVLPKCEEVGFGVNCIISTGGSAGQVYNGSYKGPISIGQWKDLTNKYSQQYGLDPCIGYTIIRKESGSGDPNAIGHDNHSRNSDKFVPNSPPNFGLSFETKTWSHGIGLTQITIFPEGSTQGNANWPSFPVVNGKKTPARRADTIPVQGENSSKYYTIADLLNPDTSIRLALGKMAYHLKQTGNLEVSFKKYNGAQVYATSAMGIYNECKKGNVGS